MTTDRDRDRTTAGVARAADFDELRVVRDGEVVDRVVDPSPAGVDRPHAETTDTKGVVTPPAAAR